MGIRGLVTQLQKMGRVLGMCPTALIEAFRQSPCCQPGALLLHSSCPVPQPGGFLGGKSLPTITPSGLWDVFLPLFCEARLQSSKFSHFPKFVDVFHLQLPIFICSGLSCSHCPCRLNIKKNFFFLILAVSQEEGVICMCTQPTVLNTRFFYSFFNHPPPGLVSHHSRNSLCASTDNCQVYALFPVITLLKFSVLLGLAHTHFHSCLVDIFFLPGLLKIPDCSLHLLYWLLFLCSLLKWNSLELYFVPLFTTLLPWF